MKTTQANTQPENIPTGVLLPSDPEKALQALRDAQEFEAARERSTAFLEQMEHDRELAGCI